MPAWESSTSRVVRSPRADAPGTALCPLACVPAAATTTAFPLFTHQRGDVTVGRTYRRTTTNGPIRGQTGGAPFVNTSATVSIQKSPQQPPQYNRQRQTATGTGAYAEPSGPAADAPMAYIRQTSQRGTTVWARASSGRIDGGGAATVIAPRESSYYRAMSHAVSVSPSGRYEQPIIENTFSCRRRVGPVAIGAAAHQPQQQTTTMSSSVTTLMSPRACVSVKRQTTIEVVEKERDALRREKEAKEREMAAQQQAAALEREKVAREREIEARMREQEAREKALALELEQEAREKAFEREREQEAQRAVALEREREARERVAALEREQEMQQRAWANEKEAARERERVQREWERENENREREKENRERETREREARERELREREREIAERAAMVREMQEHEAKERQAREKESREVAAQQKTKQLDPSLHFFVRDLLNER
eukprot:GHVU01083574.1.p1 GENE.GHVU01083574.1~~GHVU01083574.1.p1  ORF type:complete len:438 (+),score=92.93 GHVU01083574.1:283-1596(+)